MIFNADGNLSPKPLSLVGGEKEEEANMDMGQGFILSKN
jgi:hypothetical protein